MATRCAEIRLIVFSLALIGGWLCGSLTMCQGEVESLPVHITAAIDRTQVYVGEPIRYTVEATAPKGVEVSLAPLEMPQGSCTIERSSPRSTRTARGRTTHQWRMHLACYAVGTHTLTPPSVTAQAPDGASHEAHAEPLAITVNSLLPSDWESQDIRGIKPPIVHVPWWLVLLILGGGLGVGGAIAWWWRRRRSQVAPRPPLPPHVIALQALEQLRRDGLITQGRYEEYYVRLSGILRTYIEGRFGLRAPEMTTEEFLETASRAAALSETQRQRLREFLAHCDMVKFARYQPSSAEAEATCDIAQHFIQETVPVETVTVSARSSNA